MAGLVGAPSLLSNSGCPHYLHRRTEQNRIYDQTDSINKPALTLRLHFSSSATTAPLHLARHVLAGGGFGLWPWGFLLSHRISTSASQTQSRWGQPLLPPRPSHVRDSLRGTRKMRLRSPVDERTLVVQSRDSSTPSEGQKNGGHPTHLAFRAIALQTTCAITPRPSPMRATRDSKQGLSWSLYSLHSQQTSFNAHQT